MTESDTRPPSRKLWWVVLAAVLVAIVVVAVFAFGRGTPAPAGSASPIATPRATASSPSPTASPTPSAPEAPPAAGDEVAPVPFDQTAQFTPALSVRVDDVQAVEGTSSVPGETSGPALRFTLTFRNDSGAPVDLTKVVVNSYYGDSLTPANPLMDGSSPLPAMLDTGNETSADFVFRVPADQRDQVRVEVDFSVDTPVVVFEGQAPTA